MKIHHFLVGVSIQDNKLFLLQNKETGLWDCPRVVEEESREEIRLIHYVRKHIGTDLKIEGRLGDIEIQEEKTLKRLSLFNIKFLGGINLNDENVSLWHWADRVEMETIGLSSDLKNYILPFCIDKRLLI